MNKADEQFQNILSDILENGIDKGDRTGTGTYSVFSRKMRFNMNEGFPLLTTKKMFTKAVVHELLWFLNAISDEYKTFSNTNIKYLVDHDVNIWTNDAYRVYSNKDGCDLSFNEFKTRIKEDDDFARKYGNLGPIYGEQWNRWFGDPFSSYGNIVIDQIGDVVKALANNPDSRRLIVSSWNVAELGRMALPPCHVLFQFYTFVDNEGERNISLELYQRSCDMFLGVPFNIASYSILLHMVAQAVNMKPYEFIWEGADCHIYKNHVDQAKEQISRTPYELPSLILTDGIYNLRDFRYGDIKFLNYQYHPPIKADLSV